MSEIKLSRIKVQGDSISGQKNRVWIDDKLTSNVTSVNIHWDAEGVNEATIGLLLLDGLDVDSVAKVRVDEPTHELLVSLGWISPERLNEAVAKGEVSINTARALMGLEPWSFPEASTADRPEPRTFEYPVGTSLTDEDPQS